MTSLNIKTHFHCSLTTWALWLKSLAGEKNACIREDRMIKDKRKKRPGVKTKVKRREREATQHLSFAAVIA